MVSFLQEFIDYEELNKKEYLKLILEKLNFNQIKNLNLSFFKNSNKKDIEINHSNDIYKNAKDIYIDFRNKSIYNKL